MASFTEDLEALEKSIRQLQIEWEKFFGGVEKKPPVDLRTRVENMLRKHDFGDIRNNTERFRFMNLTARYNTFNELWNKRLRAIEEGRPVGLHGRAALAAMAAAPPPPVRAPAPSAGRSSEVRVGSPEGDTSAVQELFARFLEARQEIGEKGNVKFESFQKLIAQQAGRILAEKGASAVDFRLETKDGKVSLKAKPVR
ncbi:MAG: MXAN_5187 C-terminal domain-containing protein [Vicinamibacteria bacterium]